MAMKLKPRLSKKRVERFVKANRNHTFPMGITHGN